MDLEALQLVRGDGEGEVVVGAEGVEVQALADKPNIASPVVPDKVPPWYAGWSTLLVQ